MRYTLWLDDDRGNHLALLDQFISINYVRVVNGVGAWSISLPGRFDWHLLDVDRRVEIWREVNGSIRLQTVGLIRKINFEDDETGLTTITISGPDINDLLRRRIVAYYAGSAQAHKSGHGDDVMKSVVRENLGESAAPERRLGYGFSVQPDLGLGPIIEKSFAWRNVLDALVEIADACRSAGVSVYFDIVPTSPTTFEFRTFTPYRGNDHSITSSSPVRLGVEFGTLVTPSYNVDHNDEANYIYAGGQGEGSERTIVEVYDTSRIGISIWNRCERFVDARNEKTEEGVRTAANEALDRGLPRRRFSGKIVDAPGCRFGIEWDFGDCLTAVYLGSQYTAMVRAVQVAVSSDGQETVSAWLETEV